MLRGYRGVHAKPGLTIFAIIGALTFGIWVVDSGLSRDAGYLGQANQRSGEYATHTQKQIRETCLPLAGADQANCVAEKRHEYRKDRREELDLVAQHKSANWAYIMGAAAVFGMVLSAVGVVLIWTTFRETKEANVIARNTARYQSRAYLAVSGFRVSGVPTPTAQFTVENKGMTPARQIDVYAEFWTDFVRQPRGRNLHGIVWEIGCHLTQMSNLVFSIDKCEAWDNALQQAYNFGAIEMYLEGFIKYIDQFDQVQWVFFKWNTHVHWDGNVQREIQSLCADGNLIT